MKSQSVQFYEANPEQLQIPTIAGFTPDNSAVQIHIKDNNGVEHIYRLSDVIDALLLLLKDVPEIK